MLYAEWSGKRVQIRRETRQLIRDIFVNNNVVGVQISGDSPTEATVAITMDNGKTDIFKSSGMLLRRG